MIFLIIIIFLKAVQDSIPTFQTSILKNSHSVSLMGFSTLSQFGCCHVWSTLRDSVLSRETNASPLAPLLLLIILNESPAATQRTDHLQTSDSIITGAPSLLDLIYEGNRSKRCWFWWHRRSVIWAAVQNLFHQCGELQLTVPHSFKTLLKHSP